VLDCSHQTHFLLLQSLHAPCLTRNQVVLLSACRCGLCTLQTSNCTNNHCCGSSHVERERRRLLGVDDGRNVCKLSQIVFYTLKYLPCAFPDF
jgi:hypothetical protein